MLLVLTARFLLRNASIRVVLRNTLGCFLILETVAAFTEVYEIVSTSSSRLNDAIRPIADA